MDPSLLAWALVVTITGLLGDRSYMSVPNRTGTGRPGATTTLAVWDHRPSFSLTSARLSCWVAHVPHVHVHTKSSVCWYGPNSQKVDSQHIPLSLCTLCLSASELAYHSTYLAAKISGSFYSRQSHHILCHLGQVWCPVPGVPDNCTSSVQTFHIESTSYHLGCSSDFSRLSCD